MAQPPKSSGRLILAAILAIFVYGMIAAMLGTINPRLTPQEINTVGLTQAVGLILASLSAGPLVDNKGKKLALVIGLALIAFALAMLPGSEPGGTMRVFFFILGFGGGIVVTAGNALVSDINEERRASTLNLLNLFFGLGFMSTPFVSAHLLRSEGSLLMTGAALAAVALFVIVTAPIPPPSGERGFRPSQVGAVLGRPALWLLALLLFLYVACEVGFANNLVKYLTQRGIPEDTAKSILSLGFGFGLLVGRVVVSRILIRVPAPTVTMAAAVLMAITTYLVTQATSPTMAWVVVFCAGLAMAPVFPTTLGMVGDAFPRMTATAMGIVITFGWIGLAVASPIIGKIADEQGLDQALLVFPVASVLMLLINLALRPALKKAA
jgi:fucose permease